MKFLVALAFVAAATASPIEDTPEVAAAKAAFAAAEAGEHASLAPVNDAVQAAQIATAYLDDDEAVAAAKADFAAAFAAAEAGEHAALAPKPVEALPVAAVPLAAPAYYGNYYGAYPGYAGYYPGYAYNAYPYAAYAGAAYASPYALGNYPYYTYGAHLAPALVAPVAAEEKAEE